MAELKNMNKNRLENIIDLAELSDEQKDRLKRSIDGIIFSPKGCLHFEKTPSYEKYLTLREKAFANEGDYDFCIVEKMVNDYSGATELKSSSFPSIPELSDLVESYKGIIDCEIVDAHNYQKMVAAEKDPKEEALEKNLSPAEKFREEMKKSIEKLENVPLAKKARAMSALDAISITFGNKFYSKDDYGYSESITLRTDNGNYGYYIISRYFDEYTGSTIGRNYTKLGPRGLVDYCEENKEKVDKEVKKINNKAKRENTTQQPQTKQTSNDKFER